MGIVSDRPHFYVLPEQDLMEPTVKAIKAAREMANMELPPTIIQNPIAPEIKEIVPVKASAPPMMEMIERTKTIVEPVSTEMQQHCFNFTFLRKKNGFFL